MSTTNERADLPARTHADAALLLRRPFAPGAIGFRAMMKVLFNGDPFGDARVATYLGSGHSGGTTIRSTVVRIFVASTSSARRAFMPSPSLTAASASRMCSVSTWLWPRSEAS
jgi:hypothetical protein